MTDPLRFLPGIPVEKVVSRLAAAGGKEIESGKLASPESSAALAVNCFGWFIDRPQLLPPIPDISVTDWPAEVVNIEYCARFPWSGGRHPWLDAVVETPGWLIGVEPKRFEPFRDKKSVSLSLAYDRPCWGNNMERYQRMRNDLRTGSQRFHFLDAAQLVKHAFGLVTDARRKCKRPALVYCFAEPERRGTTPIDPADQAAHRREIGQFAAAVAGDEVEFGGVSYRDWFSGWPDADGLADHRRAIADTFAP